MDALTHQGVCAQHLRMAFFFTRNILQSRAEQRVLAQKSHLHPCNEKGRALIKDPVKMLLRLLAVIAHALRREGPHFNVH